MACGAPALIKPRIRETTVFLIEDYEFTYWDYLKCIGKYDELFIKDGTIVYTDSPESFLSVCEDEEEYQVDNDVRENDKKHDKIFKTLFSVDYSMPYRILNYCVETIRLAIDGKNINNKYYKFPKVIPIVLYIGNTKWNASTSFVDCEVEYPELNFNSLDTKFKLIDLNNFEVEDLLRLNTIVANAMILEKCKNNDEVIENLKKILKNSTGKKAELIKLKQIITLYNHQNCKEALKVLFNPSIATIH